MRSERVWTSSYTGKLEGIKSVGITILLKDGHAGIPTTHVRREKPGSDPVTKRS